MNTEVLEQTLRIMAEKLAQAELQNAVLQAQLTILKGEEENATSNNAN